MTHFRSVSEYAFNVLVRGGPGQSRVARRAAQLGLTRLSRAAPHWRRRREPHSQSELSVIRPPGTNVSVTSISSVQTSSDTGHTDYSNKHLQRQTNSEINVLKKKYCRK